MLFYVYEDHTICVLEKLEMSIWYNEHVQENLQLV